MKFTDLNSWQCGLHSARISLSGEIIKLTGNEFGPRRTGDIRKEGRALARLASARRSPHAASVRRQSWRESSASDSAAVAWEGGRGRVLGIGGIEHDPRCCDTIHAALIN